MNFDLDTDQRDAAAGAREFFTGSASPAAARAALEGGALEPGHKALADIGFLGITVAEDAGGAGGSLLDLAVVAEQGGAVLAGPSLVTAARAAVLLADVPGPGRGARPTGRPRSPCVDGGRRRRSTPRARRSFLALEDGALVVGAGEVTVGAPIDATRGLASVRLTDRRVLAEDAGELWARARQVGRGRARRRGPRRRRPRRAAGCRVREGAAGVRPGRSARTRRSSTCWSTPGSGSTSCARWCGGRPGPRTTPPAEFPLAASAAKAYAARVFEQAAETRHPGARRHRLHLGARRAPVLAAGEGRPAAAGRRGRAPRRRRPARGRRRPRPDRSVPSRRNFGPKR